MSIPDIINGSIEAVASLFLWLNVAKIYKDKAYSGVSLASVVFFTAWGYWNLYFYPSLGQWSSFAGGIAVVIANTVWVSLMFKYRKRK